MLSQAELDARLARYHLTADARDLWPDVPARALLDGREEVARVTAAVLATSSSTVELRCPSGVEAHALGVATFSMGLGPLI